VTEPATGELGAFVRARRDRIGPAGVGLPDSGQRRVPGLRREEVAALADVSADYLRRTEQGRVLPSNAVLDRLADAQSAGVKLLDHPRVGRLELDYETFEITPLTGQILIVYTAAPGSATADALETLTAGTVA
jgi:transcriptional regulator with XRE-family HTH domain